MADLTLTPEDITGALRRNLEGWSPSIEAETVGYVDSVGDGVARVVGLPNVMTSELLEFPGGLTGVALNLDEDSIGCVIMGDASKIEEGAEVRSTGRVLSVPVGDGQPSGSSTRSAIRWMARGRLSTPRPVSSRRRLRRLCNGNR